MHKQLCALVQQGSIYEGGTMEFLINVMVLINMMLLNKESYCHVFYVLFCTPNKGVMDGNFSHKQINVQHVY